MYLQPRILNKKMMGEEEEKRRKKKGEIGAHGSGMRGEKVEWWEDIRRS